MNRFTQESALAQPVRPQGVTSAQVATVCRRDWPIVVWGWRPIDRATKCVFVVRSSLRRCSEIYCPPFFAETVMAWQDYIDVMESRWKRRKTIIEQSSKAPPLSLQRNVPVWSCRETPRASGDEKGYTLEGNTVHPFQVSYQKTPLAPDSFRWVRHSSQLAGAEKTAGVGFSTVVLNMLASRLSN